eukprot:GHVS01067985.1.p1 GENE.GHVS01067985.1~~GHVS01067985.1.p1  ORF type:complete len:255 (+),score=28.46 GHVS01067985.1:71-766(+)
MDSIHRIGDGRSAAIVFLLSVMLLGGLGVTQVRGSSTDSREKEGALAEKEGALAEKEGAVGVLGLSNEIGTRHYAERKTPAEWVKMYMELTDLNSPVDLYAEEATHDMIMPVVDEYADPPYTWFEVSLRGLRDIERYFRREPLMELKTVFDVVSDEQLEGGGHLVIIKGTRTNLDDPTSPVLNLVQTFLLVPYTAPNDMPPSYQIRATTTTFGLTGKGVTNISGPEKERDM